MSVKEKIESFKKRSSKVLAISGGLLTFSVFLGLILFFSLLEDSFWFNTQVRTVLFVILISSIVYLFVAHVLTPLLVLLGLRNGSSTEETAHEIADKLPEINDDLINYLQLEKESENELAKASLEQKITRLFPLDFTKAIDTSKNKKYGRVFLVLVIALVTLAFVNPPTITGGTERLIKFNKEFVKPAPFTFEVTNDSLKTFANQQFVLTVELNGQNIPETTSVIIDSRAFSMNRSVNGGFSYTFNNISSEVEFQIEASGFRSRTFKLEVLNKPQLNLFNIRIDPPKYTGLDAKTITNTGNVNAPSGSLISWNIETSHANRAEFYFSDDTVEAKRLDETNFKVAKKVREGGMYQIKLDNEFASNESKLNYRLNITPDETPKIRATFLPDTSFFKFVIATGRIEDDYGFRKLDLVWEINGERFVKPVEINKNTRNQEFYVEWYTDSAKLNSTEELEMYLVVHDNDQPAGYKQAKSSIFQFRKPDFQELSDIIDKKSQSAENQMDKSIEELEKLKEMLEKLSDRLKAERDVNWQEEKLLEETIEQRKEIEEMLKELKEKHDDLIKANDNFEQNEQLKEKSEKLNELMESLMDKETEQLYEELQKLLQEKSSSDELREKLEQISRQENRTQKDLERTKELFKRFKLESGLQRISQQLDSLASDQMKLSEESVDSSSMEKQSDIQEKFEELTEDLEKLEELNQELDKPEPLEDFNSDEKQIKEEMKDAMEEMQSGDQKKSKKSQQKAGQQMQKMSDKMQSMQSGMEMEVMQENIEQLRKILDDLVKLSFSQEELIGDFRTVNSSDPRFISLSQDQIKLQEDLVVIEDSLLALASRVVQLSSFITKEVEQIDFQMKSAVEQIRERQRGRALSHQQFSMTSMNNLALLLNDVLQNMQMTMSEANGKGSQDQQQMTMPQLGEMQQQLGDQIQKLQNGEKSGRELSEELARMAAEQEMIRRQLEQMREQMEGQFGSEGGDELKKAIEMMEDNEVDLVNKQITRQLMMRQKEITTRLLEAEDAMKEQEKDPEREGETAKQRERLFPPNFEEYLNERKKEIELLRSVPLELHPFYKKEVNDYFRRLSESN
jgi:hypothetical protein